jgi:DNA-binding PadR family transcriptional regulator
MKSLTNISSQPLSIPLVADDITELHAARMILLLRKCGTGNRVKGLTKLAKLDFLVRYPAFFNRLSVHLQKQVTAVMETVESVMIRHHYGPWDKRYYTVLPFLESRNLITVSKEGATYVFELTRNGKRLADDISKRSEFADQVEQMKQVKELVGKKSGTALKNIVYEVFDTEIAQKPLGDIIQ